MKNKSYLLFLCFVFCRAAAQVSSPDAGTDTKIVAPAAEPPKRTKLEIAADDMIAESLQRDTELVKKSKVLADKLGELTRNTDPKKAPKDTLTPTQLDEFNMVTAQWRYLALSRYAEAIKRRKILALRSLIEAEEKDDELFADHISIGDTADLTEINTAISGKLKELGLSDWETAMEILNELQNNKDARSISLKLVVPSLQYAKMSGSPAPDNVAFLMVDDLKNTTAFKIFLSRLDSEINKGNKDAAAVAQYLVDEMNDNESKKPSP